MARTRSRALKLIVVSGFVTGLLLFIQSVQNRSLFLQKSSPSLRFDAINATNTATNTATNIASTAIITSRRIVARMRMSGGRLGNEMFIYAALLGIAEKNKMIPVYYCRLLRTYFEITAEERSPREVEGASLVESSPFRKEPRFDSLATSHSGDVTIVGFFQSWTYFHHIRAQVRQELTFKSEFRLSAENFLQEVAVNNGLGGDVVYVGVHIRRTDMLHGYNVYKGYTVADEAYLNTAVSYMIEALKKQRTAVGRPLSIVFVVCSDDLDWSKEYFDGAVFRATYTKNNQLSTVYRQIPVSSQPTGLLDTSMRLMLSTPGAGQLKAVSSMSDLFTRQPVTDVNTALKTDDGIRVKTVYSEGRSEGHDLAILSQCNHTIMTVGTYGWWAGYLAGGMTIYYKNFPKPGSELSFLFKTEEFFPPEWIGL